METPQAFALDAKAYLALYKALKDVPGGFQGLMKKIRRQSGDHILRLYQEDIERLRNYRGMAKGSGGYQGRCKELLRIVDGGVRQESLL